ncbi:hypothetical protein AB0B50_16285 [Streptomyces sp. NPDC041068]|uniref:hypothetical protein n=1 Tax=Streptomyces sp. NPDC041068 TaxID=3155130 RepID=UPI0033C9FFB8
MGARVGRPPTVKNGRTLWVLLSGEHAKKIKDMAASEDRSIAGMARRLLVEALEARERETA